MNGMKKYKEKIALVMICIIYILLACWQQKEKADYNMDEIVTYTFANNTGNKQWDWQQKIDNPKESLEDFFTVNEYNPPFNYVNTWRNSERDTHPPFYYLLVHTVSSVFPGRFNKWIPFSVNVFWGCLIVLAVYKLVKILMEKELAAVLCAFIFAVNPALIEMTTFLRMYVMGMFCCLLLTCLAVKYWGNWNRSFYIFNTLILVFGCLTHYYFLVYAFFVYGMTALYHLLLKQWKNVGWLILSGMAGIGIVLLVFPAILDHMFGGGDGPKNFENLFHWSDYAIRLRKYFGFLNQDVFHGIAVVLIIVAIAGFGMAYRKREYLFLWRISAMAVSVICYFLIVAKVSPYLQDRYLCIVYPMVVILIFTGIVQFAEAVLKNRKTGLGICLCGMIFTVIELSAYPQYKWDYTLKSFVTEIQPQLDQVKKYDCLAVSDASWKIWTYYQQLSQYATITYLKPNQELELDPEDYKGESLIVYLSSEDDEVFLDKLLDRFSQYTSYESIISPKDSSLCNIYRLY